MLKFEIPDGRTPEEHLEFLYKIFWLAQEDVLEFYNEPDAVKGSTVVICNGKPINACDGGDDEFKFEYIDLLIDADKKFGHEYEDAWTNLRYKWGTQFEEKKIEKYFEAKKYFQSFTRRYL